VTVVTVAEEGEYKFESWLRAPIVSGSCPEKLLRSISLQQTLDIDNTTNTRDRTVMLE